MIREYEEAATRHRRAAEAGERGSRFALGLMHGLGLGVPQDYAQAVHWYRLAARAGDSRAQSNLGYMYGTGRGVPQDWVMAYAWYNVAAAGGEDMARRNRDLVAERMTASQLEQAQQRSMTLFDEIDRTG